MATSNNNQDVSIDGAKEVKKEIVRKIIVDPEVITKMKRLTSLYADEIPEGSKEIDVISFFFNKSFELFLKSGEIERKLDEIKGA
jgi:hypothetical protein